MKLPDKGILRKRVTNDDLAKACGRRRMLSGLIHSEIIGNKEAYFHTLAFADECIKDWMKTGAIGPIGDCPENNTVVMLKQPN